MFLATPHDVPETFRKEAMAESTFYIASPAWNNGRRICTAPLACRMLIDVSIACGTRSTDPLLGLDPIRAIRYKPGPIMPRQLVSACAS